MVTLTLKCRYCGKTYQWQGADIFERVADDVQVLRCFGHIVRHHWHEMPKKFLSCASAFHVVLRLLLHSVLLVLRVLSFVLYPLYWVLSLLFEE